MEKRLLLALALSIAVLLAWNFLGPKPKPAQTPPQVESAQRTELDGPPAAAQAQGAPTTPLDDSPVLGEKLGEAQERTLTLAIGKPGEVGSYHALFTNRGARLLELKLGNSFDSVGLDAAAKADVAHWTTLVESKESSRVSSGSLTWRSDVSSRDLEREPLERALWRMREIENGVEFDLAQGAGVRFVKRVTFVPNTYSLKVDLEIENQALPAPRRAGYLFSPAEVMPLESGDKFYVEPQAIAAGRGSDDLPRRLKLPQTKSIPRQDNGSERSGSFEVPSAEISFAGVHNKYFAVLMRGADPFSVASITAARWRRMYDDAAARAHPERSADQWKYMATDLVLELSIPAQGERTVYSYSVYAGPKALKPLLAEHADFEALHDADLGSFLCMSMAGIGNVLLAVLRFFHGIVGNWGVAIILLTLCVRLALFPINRSSQTAMAKFQKRMKRLQPQIDEIKRRHADDAGKAREEQQKLMAKEGMVPPLGGCAPMFLQIPVFFGLFSSLRTSFDLRHAPFMLWMNDLSKPDALLVLNFDTHLPLIGVIHYLNLLPILMVVLWVWQQKLMPTPTDEQAARMQKMMMFMPILMGFFLYNYAAGLSVYMITQSGLGILEMTVVKKIWPIDDSIPEKGQEPKGWMQRLMERAQEAQKGQRRRDGGKGR